MRRTCLLLAPCALLALLVISRRGDHADKPEAQAPPPLASSVKPSYPRTSTSQPWTPAVLEAIPKEFQMEYLRSTWQGDTRLESGQGGLGLTDRSAEERKSIFQKLAPYVDRAAFDQLSPTHADMVMRIADAIDKDVEMAEICFSEGTPLAVVRAVHALVAATRSAVAAQRAKGPKTADFMAQALQLTQRWSSTATNGSGLSQGDPTVVRWSIVPDGTAISGLGAGEPAAPSSLRAKLNALYGSQSAWLPLFQSTFDRVGELAGVKLVYEPNDDGVPLATSAGQTGVRGDIRIGGHPIDGTAGTLAYNYFPNNGDMVLDSDDGLIFSSTSTNNNSLILRNILAHENGHGLGLSHVCPLNKTKLMEPFLATNFDGLQFDDIVSLNRHYGDPNEPNDAFGTAATDLGTMTPSKTHLSELRTIDDGDDTDSYTFTFGQVGYDVFIEARPLAPKDSPYLEGPQNALDGTCSVGSLYDPLRQNNLQLAFYDSLGNLLRQSNVAPIGQAEIMPAGMVAAGRYYVRVSGSPGVEAAQPYELRLNFTPSKPHVGANGMSLQAEYCDPPSGAIDPGEIVTVNFTIQNVGALSIPNLEVSMQSNSQILPANAEAVSFGSVAPNASATRSFSFKAFGACGSKVQASLACKSGTEALETLTYELSLGSAKLESEAFDGVTAPNLPTGWTNVVAGTGTPKIPATWTQPAAAFANWRTQTASASSAPNVSFAPDFEPVSVTTYIDRMLVSPAFAVTSTEATVEFRHQYGLEDRWDGAVLELQIAEGIWEDIMAAGGEFLTGGYNVVMRSNTGTPIASRSAWSQQSPGFVTTKIKLPASTLNKNVRFRWRIVCDGSNPSAYTGWLVDDIHVQNGYSCCEPQAPQVGMTLTDSIAVEPLTGVGLNIGRLTITRVGPTFFPLPVTYSVGGTATNAVDYQSLSQSASIPSGAASVNIDVKVLADNVGELDETVILTLGQSENYKFQGGSAPSGTVVIRNYGPTITLAPDDTEAREWSSGTSADNGAFIIAHDAPLTFDVTVRYAATGAGNGVATSGQDYATLSSSSLLSIGQTSKVLSVIPIRDSLPEGPETVTVRLLPDPLYRVGTPSEAVITILDTPYDQWRKDKLLGKTSFTGDDDDPDHDDISNMVEYAFGLDPLRATDFFCETGKETEILGNGEPEHFVTLDYRIPVSVQDLLHIPECSTNISDWSSSPVSTSVASSTSQHTVYRARVRVEPDSRKFLHVRFSRP